MAVVGARLGYPLLVRESARVPDSQLQEVVHVDIESGEVFLIRARRSPETNPDTGEQTLVPAMYCQECKAWKPVGSMEMLQTKRAARNCPIHKTPLSQEGPLPEEFSE